ncbi:MAG: hypothetical protein WDZ81_01305 [Candidatus Saccharimonadales bacterium]
MTELRIGKENLSPAQEFDGDTPKAVAALTAETAQKISVQEVFDREAAEPIARNLAVLVDRLSPSDFNSLTKETREGIERLAEFAIEVIGVEVDKTSRAKGGFNYDAALERKYNTEITEPLRGLQGVLASGEYNPWHAHHHLPAMVEAMGRLFADAYLETVKLIPRVAETTGYFRSNAESAARRV